jgi:tetratricopeptide (TPR) repeat protein
MSDNPRIEELRRRIQNDPASIAFAQLAEEYRRAGHYQEAVETCRAGLTVHPGYLSARVTLGRGLIELNDLDAAETELRHVLNHAPENLAAVRGLAEVHHRRGNLGEALAFYQSALALAKHDPDLEQTVEEISRAIAPARAPIADGLSFEQAAAEFLLALDEITQRSQAETRPADRAGPLPEADLSAVESVDTVVPTLRSAEPADDVVPAMMSADTADISQRPPEVSEDPALPRLERFLDAIQTYRRRRVV